MLGSGLLVDEAFMDAAPPAGPRRRNSSNVLVLRSFGKFFGLAGLRSASRSRRAFAVRLRVRSAWCPARRLPSVRRRSPCGLDRGDARAPRHGRATARRF
jgi:hypothetical protein